MADISLNLPTFQLPVLSRLFQAYGATKRRRHLSALQDLPDHLLKDVGVTRGDVDAALARPLSADAAQELYHASLGHRAL